MSSTNTRRFFLLVLTISLFFIVKAQLFAQKNDSNTQIKENEALQLEFDSLYEVAMNLFDRDLEAGLTKGHEILEKGEELNYLRGIAAGYNVIGVYYYYIGQLDSAVYYFETGLKKRKELGDSLLIGLSIGNVAAIYDKKGQYDKALAMFTEAFDYIPPNDKKNMAGNYQNVGAMYVRKGDYAKGLEYTLKAYDIYIALDPNSDETASTYYNLGNIYHTMLNYDKGLEYYNRAKAIYEKNGSIAKMGDVYLNMGGISMRRGNIDTALMQFDIANNYFESMSDAYGKAGVLTNSGLAYYLKGNYDQSLKNYLKSIALWESLDNDFQKSETLARIGQMYLADGNYKAAINSYEKARATYSGQPDVDYEVSYGLARAYEGLGQFDKALPHQTRSLFLKDSINLEKISWKNTESEYLLNKSKIETLEKENELLDEKRKKSRIVLITSIAILLLIIALLAFLIRIRRINQIKRLAEKEAKIKQNELEALLKDQELVSIRNVLEMQDKERKRIAQDLHDRLGSTLSMVKLHFENTNKRLAALQEQNIKEYEKANTLLDEAVEEVRKIAYNLNSGMLKNFGLVAALEELSDSLRNSGHFEVEFITHRITDRMSTDFEASVYRVIQELISNIIRHADATEISIQLLRKDDVLQVEVSDNGKGFNLAQVKERQGGMGLKNIESRLHKFDGKVDIDSQPERGTTVFLHIPIPE